MCGNEPRRVSSSPDRIADRVGIETNSLPCVVLGHSLRKGVRHRSSANEVLDRIWIRHQDDGRRWDIAGDLSAHLREAIVDTDTPKSLGVGGGRWIRAIDQISVHSGLSSPRVALALRFIREIPKVYKTTMIMA